MKRKESFQTVFQTKEEFFEKQNIILTSTRGSFSLPPRISYLVFILNLVKPLVTLIY